MPSCGQGGRSPKILGEAVISGIEDPFGVDVKGLRRSEIDVDKASHNERVTISIKICEREYPSRRGLGGSGECLRIPAERRIRWQSSPLEPFEATVSRIKLSSRS